MLTWKHRLVACLFWEQRAKARAHGSTVLCCTSELSTRPYSSQHRQVKYRTTKLTIAVTHLAIVLQHRVLALPAIGLIMQQANIVLCLMCPPSLPGLRSQLWQPCTTAPATPDGRQPQRLHCPRQLTGTLLPLCVSAMMHSSTNFCCGA